MTSRRQFHAASLGLAATALGLPARLRAQATDFPSRPVKIIVPYAAGGGPDVLTRKMAVKLAEVLGKGGVVVDNIVGAGGILAAQQVARMAPDGYSLITGASTHLVQKAMQPSVKFDPVKDFVHITLTSYSPLIMVVAPNAPWKTAEEVAAAARKEPGKLNYASGGMGSGAHLCAAAWAAHGKLDVVHVPYKGSVDIIPSILSGHTQFAFPVASTAIPLIQAGKVRALAVSHAQRLPLLPNVPTLVEAFKAPELALDAWGGLWAPAGTPADVVDILFKALVKTHQDPGVRADTEAAGAVMALSSSPAEFARFVQAETQKWEKVVKAANLVSTS